MQNASKIRLAEKAAATGSGKDVAWFHACFIGWAVWFHAGDKQAVIAVESEADVLGQRPNIEVVLFVEGFGGNGRLPKNVVYLVTMEARLVPVLFV